MKRIIRRILCATGIHAWVLMVDVGRVIPTVIYVCPDCKRIELA